MPAEAIIEKTLEEIGMLLRHYVADLVTAKDVVETSKELIEKTLEVLDKIKEYEEVRRKTCE